MNKKVMLLSGILALVAQRALPSSSSLVHTYAHRHSIVGRIFEEFEYDTKAECFPHPIYFREQIKKVDDINVCRDSKNQTLLHVIAIDGHVRQLRELVTHPFLDPNRQDIYGNTALHYAAQNDDFEVVEFLLKLPTINLSISNLDGKTPEHYVTNPKILRMIENHKAGLPLASRKRLTPTSSATIKKPVAKRGRGRGR